MPDQRSVCVHMYCLLAFRQTPPTEARACQLTPFLFHACWQAVTSCCRQEAGFLEHLLQAVHVASLHPLWTVP